MKRNITLIPTLTANHGSAYVSDKAQGSGYYKSNNPVHTMTYALANGFKGTVKFQATLVMNPTETDWADLPETAITVTDEVPIGVSVSMSKTVRGQFVWVRAVVQNFIAGAIEKVSYSYN